MKKPAKETLVTQPGTVSCVIEEKTDHFRKHLVLLYVLLTLSFALHLYTIIEVNLEFDYEIITSRERRDTNQRRNVAEPSSANVEFIHPKLREDMKDDEDPENPWVWLTSFSRVPVRLNKYTFAAA